MTTSATASAVFLCIIGANNRRSSSFLVFVGYSTRRRRWSLSLSLSLAQSLLFSLDIILGLGYDNTIQHLTGLTRWLSARGVCSTSVRQRGRHSLSVISVAARSLSWLLCEMLRCGSSASGIRVVITTLKFRLSVCTISTISISYCCTSRRIGGRSFFGTSCPARVRRLGSSMLRRRRARRCYRWFILSATRG